MANGNILDYMRKQNQVDVNGKLELVSSTELTSLGLPVVDFAHEHVARLGGVGTTCHEWFTIPAQQAAPSCPWASNSGRSKVRALSGGSSKVESLVQRAHQ